VYEVEKPVEQLNLRRIGEWLSGEVELRLPKAWLAVGALAVLILVGIALD
jgi:hypothetical protein